MSRMNAPGGDLLDGPMADAPIRTEYGLYTRQDAEFFARQSGRDVNWPHDLGRGFTVAEAYVAIARGAAANRGSDFDPVDFMATTRRAMGERSPFDEAMITAAIEFYAGELVPA